MGRGPLADTVPPATTMTASSWTALTLRLTTATYDEAATVVGGSPPTTLRPASPNTSPVVRTRGWMIIPAQVNTQYRRSKTMSYFRVVECKRWGMTLAIGAWLCGCEWACSLTPATPRECLRTICARIVHHHVTGAGTALVAVLITMAARALTTMKLSNTYSLLGTC